MITKTGRTFVGSLQFAESWDVSYDTWDLVFRLLHLPSNAKAGGH